MGTDATAFERDILGSHLSKRDYPSIVEAMHSNDQEGSFDADAFNTGLEACLAEGRFRLVVVLDSAPAELVRIGGFLEAVSDRLTVHLITVSEYSVGDTSILVPQRLDPGRQPESSPAPPRSSTSKDRIHEGWQVFADAITEAPLQEQPRVRRLLEWAQDLEKSGWAWLQSYEGKAHRWTLLPNVARARAGLVTLWNDNGAAIQFWRSMFEKHAPKTLPEIEAHIAPKKLGQGTTTREFDDRLLELLAAAYREAAQRR